MLLYETVFRSQVYRPDVIRYDLPFPSTMGCGVTTRRFELPKPGEGTTIKSVSWKLSGELIADGTPLTPVSCQAFFKINGQLVAEKSIFAATLPGTRAPFDFLVNVTAYAYIGQWNEFIMELNQSWNPLGCVSRVQNFMSYIEYEYEGEPPPPPKPEEPEWMKYLKWGLIGAGAIGAVFVSLKAVEVIKKK